MNFNEFLNEGSTSTYGGPAGLTKDETLKIAQKFADAAASVDPEKGKWGVNKRTLEEDGFDLDYNDEEFDGGSYNIYKNGNVVNMALRENPVLGKIGDDIKTIAKGFKKMMANESVTNEANLVLGLSTNNYPAGTIGRYRIESTVINLRKVADLSKDSWSKYSRAFTDTEIGFEKSSDRKEALAAIQKSFDSGKNDIREFGINESVVNESKVVLDTTEPGDKYLVDFCKKHGIKMKEVNPNGPGGDFAEYEYTGTTSNLKKMIDEFWEDDYLHSLIESVVTEASAFMAKDVNKTVDFLNDETGGNPGYLFFGEDDDIEKFDKLWKSRRYQVALDMLAQDREIEAQSLEDVKLFIKESVVNERNITIKRHYTDKNPAVTVGKAAKVRNRMLEAIKDGKLSQEDFNNILKEMTTDSKRWLRRNAQCFNVSEDGISLSKTGSRILKNVMVAEATTNEGLNYKKLAKQFVDDEWLDVNDNIEDLDADEYFDDKLNAFNREELGNSKEFDNNKTNMSIEVKKLLKGRLKQIFEATTKAPKIWVPGGFDKEISKYPNSKITRKIVLDAALKWDVDPEDAIKYVEFAWVIDLDENKNNNDMKTKFIYESFQEFVENKLNEGTLNEAFKSAKLANLFAVGSAGTKDLAGAFYNFSKLAIDKIEDYDIIEMDPQTARKEKRANGVYFYVVNNQKENPYIEGKIPNTYNNGIIQSNTLLAITNGSNEWYSTSYSRYSKSETLAITKTREDASGFDKRDSKRYDGSGITSLTKVAELADIAYVIDLDVLKARYSTTSLVSKRAADKSGATAFQNDKDFKAANKARYNEILAQKASELPMDSLVLGAIDTLATQIKDALSKGEKGRYGELIVGLDPKGREIKMSDASNLMRNILDEYNRYVGYAVESEKEVATGYSGKFYEGRLKESAKTITDYVKKVDAKNYAW